MLVLKRRPGLLPVLCSGFSTLLFIQSCRPSLERTNASKPNVVLITVDTLRADHLECYGIDASGRPISIAWPRMGSF